MREVRPESIGGGLTTHVKHCPSISSAQTCNHSPHKSPNHFNLVAKIHHPLNTNVYIIPTSFYYICNAQNSTWLEHLQEDNCGSHLRLLTAERQQFENWIKEKPILDDGALTRTSRQPQDNSVSTPDPYLPSTAGKRCKYT